MENTNGDLFEVDSAVNDMPDNPPLENPEKNEKDNAPAKGPFKLTVKKAPAISEEQKDEANNLEDLQGKPDKIEDDKKETIHSKPQKTSGERVHCTVKPVTHGELSPGQILQDARGRMNLSIDQVSLKTRIVKHYLDAIERDDYPSLPAPVFVTAYIKTLCEFYDIKEKEKDILQKLETNEKIRPVPEEILENIHRGRQVNMETEKKITLIITSIAVVLFLIVLTGVAAYAHYYYGKKRDAASSSIQGEIKPQSSANDRMPVPDPESYIKYSETIKNNFTYPQFINPTELEVMEKKAK